MAVIKDLGLEVTIIVNGEAVPEYDDPQPDTDLSHKHPVSKVIHKYIESESEIEHSIQCKALPGHRYLPDREENILQFQIANDGIEQQCPCLRFDHWTKKGARLTSLGKSEEAGKVSKFKFTAVHLYEDANLTTATRDAARAKQLGLIRVEVWRASINSEPKTSSDDEAGEDVEEAGDGAGGATDLLLAEQALKGRSMSHGTSVSSSMPFPAGKEIITIHTTVIDKQPYAIFNFKYRWRDDLRSEEIVPRTPSPEPSLDVGGLDEKELRRLARERLAQLKADKAPAKNEHSSVKREIDDVSGPSGAPEDRPRKMKRRGGQPLIVNLTDD